MRLPAFAALASSCVAVLAVPASAADFTIKMMNQGKAGSMVFEPAFVVAKVGDVVHFVPTSPSHNAEMMREILPAGVAPEVGLMNKPFDLKLAAPGLYGVKCRPHYALGMVALIQVGPKHANLGAAKAAVLPGLAAKRMNELLTMVH